MSGIFRVKHKGFAAQALKTIVLNPQRQFSHLPVRRYGGLLTVATQNLQSRQLKIAPFTPLVQKAGFMEAVIEVMVKAITYTFMDTFFYRYQVRSEIKKIENALRWFQGYASDEEVISFVDYFIEALEAHYQGPTSLKKAMMFYENKENMHWYKCKLIEVICGLEDARNIVLSYHRVNAVFLEIMHKKILWPKFEKPQPGDSLLSDIEIFLEKQKNKT